LKAALVLLALLLLPSAAAADALSNQPPWALEIKGGVFAPSLPDWSRFYGKRDMPEYGLSLAYKLFERVELGAGAGWIRGKGKALLPIHGAPSIDNVTYELYPVNIFVLARAVWSDEQWLVPYAGGGWTRIYYRQKIEDGQSARGFADGYHVRAGLQLSLDSFDSRASSRMYADYGVFNTYFFVEAERTRAVERSASVDLGGTAYLGGLRFEF
jgi:opacity protein-like surface antigen